MTITTPGIATAAITVHNPADGRVVGTVAEAILAEACRGDRP